MSSASLKAPRSTHAVPSSVSTSAPAVPLYQYQTEATDCLYEAVLDNDFEVKVKGPVLVTKCRSFYVTSPLGSGKTRMAVRTVKLISESDAFEDKVYSFDIGSESAVLKTTSNTKILIIVPVSVAPQWQKELDLWDLKYYTVITPKNIKPLSEIDARIILLTDYRTKDLKTNFFDGDFQFYVFIDEYDTCNIAKSFIETCFSFVKSKICISANFDGTDYHPVPHNHVDLCRVIVSDKIVKANIKLPDPHETILKFSLCSILMKNLEDLGSGIADNIRNGNIGYVFGMYGLPPDSTIDKFFAKFIKERRSDIADHCIKVKVTSDAYTQKVDAQCKRLQKSLDDHWSTCLECRDAIPALKDATNCLSCYGFFCQNCSKAFVNDKCSMCISISKGGTIPGDGTSYIFKTRLQCFGKILQNIKMRRATDGVSTTSAAIVSSGASATSGVASASSSGASSAADPSKSSATSTTSPTVSLTEPSKKVLIYCSYANLVASLNQHLEENNFWSFPLEGSSSARMEKISRFKAADTDIYLVCNSIQNSAGIHLPETTDIIIFHELEDKYDTQVIGRAQRIGRKTSLHIHRIQDVN